MALNDVTINKTSGGLGRREPLTDMISGFVCSGDAVVGGVQLDTVYRIESIDEAVNLGIDREYDDTNTVLVYEHIKEFFRINPNGTLYFILQSKSVEYSNLIFSLSKIVNESNGTVNQVAFAYYGSDPFTLETIATELQNGLNVFFNNHVPMIGILEANLVASVDVRSWNCPNVLIMTGQDFSVSEREIAATQPFVNYAAVGTLLGAVSRARVHQNIAWVERFNLRGGSLAIPSVLNVKVSDLTQSTLNLKNTNGHIFFRTHVGNAGIYFNDSHTAVEVTSDFAYSENVRTINKASRIVRSTLLPDLNSPVNVDPDSGQLDPIIVATLEAKVKNAITAQMLNQNEVSGFDFVIDRNQNILATSELICQLEIVPVGTARKIIVNIGFKNPFN